jgi:tetratricopeptide (TPR) repeat protein
MNLGQHEKAVFYLKKSFNRENTFGAAKNLFVTLLKLDRPEEARVYLAYAAAHNTSGTPLNSLLGMVDRIVALKAAYRQDSVRVPRCIQLAEAYLQFANGTAARKYVDEAMRLEPRNPAALALLARIEALAL